MTECLIHECADKAVERLATPETPYHYVLSGLPNVYLSGVRCRVCEECNKQEADIPAQTELLQAIARAIVEKSSRLKGPEIRFLRKRLHKKQTEFATLLSLTPQHLCAIENDPNAQMEEVREKFLRTFYPILSGDARLKHALDRGDDFERWMASISEGASGERIIATWNKRQWKVSTEPLAA